MRGGILKDEAFLLVIFEASPGDDWTSSETWYKAYPGLGISVKEDYFAAECIKAQQLPGYENTFKRLLLNIWTEQNTRWIPIETWDKSKKEIAIDRWNAMQLATQLTGDGFEMIGFGQGYASMSTLDGK